MESLDGATTSREYLPPECPVFGLPIDQWDGPRWVLNTMGEIRGPVTGLAQYYSDAAGRRALVDSEAESRSATDERWAEVQEWGLRLRFVDALNVRVQSGQDGHGTVPDGQPEGASVGNLPTAREGSVAAFGPGSWSVGGVQQPCRYWESGPFLMAYGRHSGVSISVMAKGASLSDVNLVALHEPGPFGFDIFRRQPIEVWWNIPVGTPDDLR